MASNNGEDGEQEDSKHHGTHESAREFGDSGIKVPKEDEEARKNPTFVVQAPTPGDGPAMRTTYNAAPYDPSANPNQGGWASAKSPYAFNVPETAQVGGGR